MIINQNQQNKTGGYGCLIWIGLFFVLGFLGSLLPESKFSKQQKAINKVENILYASSPNKLHFDPFSRQYYPMTDGGLRVYEDFTEDSGIIGFQHHFWAEMYNENNWECRFLKVDGDVLFDKEEKNNTPKYSYEIMPSNNQPNNPPSQIQPNIQPNIPQNKIPQNNVEPKPWDKYTTNPDQWREYVNQQQNNNRKIEQYKQQQIEEFNRQREYNRERRRR